MDKQAFHDALRLIWEVIAKANRYIDQTAPWVEKTDPARMAEVLAVCWKLSASLPFLFSRLCLGLLQSCWISY